MIQWYVQQDGLTLALSLEFFLWGYLKDIIYNRTYNAVEELQEAVRNEIAMLPIKQLHIFWHSQITGADKL